MGQIVLAIFIIFLSMPASANPITSTMCFFFGQESNLCPSSHGGQKQQESIKSNNFQSYHDKYYRFRLKNSCGFDIKYYIVFIDEDGDYRAYPSRMGSLYRNGSKEFRVWGQNVYVRAESNDRGGVLGNRFGNQNYNRPVTKNDKSFRINGKLYSSFEDIYLNIEFGDTYTYKLTCWDPSRILNRR